MWFSIISQKKAVIRLIFIIIVVVDDVIISVQGWKSILNELMNTVTVLSPAEPPSLQKVVMQILSFQHFHTPSL